MKKRDAIVRLLLINLRSEADENQKKELEKWQKESEENKKLYDSLVSAATVIHNMDEMRSFDSQNDWARVRKQLVTKRQKKRLPNWGRYVAAMVVLLFVFIYYTRIDNNPILHREETKNKALLILEDGSAVALDSDTNLGNPNIKILSRNKQLEYSESDSEEAIEWHTLKVPRGGNYRLVLADGTTILLNSETKIRYPNRFTGNERMVELVGEAYFEVKRDSARRFIITTANANICVLGTSFNVSVYPNEQNQITLVSGSVSVSTEHEKVTIVPGEQVVLKDDGLEVKSVEVQNYISWIHNRLVFVNEPIETVLNRIKRCYDIEVEIADSTIHNIRLTGDVPQYNDLDSLLRTLELTTNVTLRLNGRVLTVDRE